jgi:D-alanine-D-alanine ligase-like ATP-grasp enzyme
VPGAIEELCCKLTGCEGLTIAGFYFRVTKDERWYCLEVNPVPTFLPYEIATGQRIGDTLVDAFVKN